VRRVLAALTLAFALAGGAEARIPAAETVARAAADASRAQGRNKSYRFDVAVRTNLSAAPIARGELLVAPSRSARIELRHEEGFSERQLRRASGLSATRDGEALGDAHPLAPPFWALQAATGGELLTHLGELGGSPAQIALGYDGARDCYVLGGSGGGASIWVDKETYQVARVDLVDGTKVRFLAWASRGGAILPGAIEIETPTLTFTLELTNATVATPAADAFADAWLLGH
jgi:hypothetical protein